MDRRSFLRAGAAVGAAAIIVPEAAAKSLSGEKAAEAKAVKPRGKAKMRIGILSDIHITTEESTEYFEKALNYYKERGVDGVIIAGDLADWGIDEQLGYIGATWDRVFPDAAKAPVKLFVTGNHDITAENNKRVAGKGIPSDQFMVNHMEASWERAFHEKYEPIWKKIVCGYTFIGGMHINKQNTPGLEEFLAGAGVEGEKPFFYIQHCHPKGTCSAPWTWGQDDGSVTKILSKYPNAIAFSGHSHTSLSDDRTLWQGEFTSIGTASLRYLVPFGGRENTIVFETKEKVPSQMPVAKFKDGQQGMYMTVYDNCITIERHEFHYDGELGSWTIPLPLTTRPLTFEARAKDSVAPQYAESIGAVTLAPNSIDKTGTLNAEGKAMVTVTEADGEDRYGVAAHQYTVHFPTVRKPHAFDYEISVEVLNVDTFKPICSKRVLSTKYHLNAKDETEEMTCVFADFELSDNQPFRFAVRPLNCYGVGGSPIYSAVQKALKKA